MTGPEHYREAERLIQLAKDKSAALVGRSMAPAQATVDMAQINQTIALAQVHATLALAAVSPEYGICSCPEAQYRPCQRHNPDGYAAWAEEGMATAADPDPDYGKDLDDEEGPF